MKHKEPIIFATLTILIILLVSFSNNFHSQNKITGMVLTESLISPPADCSGIGLPPDMFIKAYEGPAWNSGGKTIKELTEQYAVEAGVHPALIAAHETKESSMGTNNKCTSIASKSALTGCGWPPSCASGCRCTGENVVSDETQIKCTARVDKLAYEAATTNKDYLGYENCYKYNGNEEKLWNCIFCTYVHGFEDEQDCGYQKDIKEMYCMWLNYYKDTDFASLTQRESPIKYYLKPSFKVHINYDLFGVYEKLIAEAKARLGTAKACFKDGKSPAQCSGGFVVGIDEEKGDHTKDYFIKFSKTSPFNGKYYNAPINYKFAIVIKDTFAPPAVELTTYYDAENKQFVLNWDKTSYDSLKYAVSCGGEAIETTETTYICYGVVDGATYTFTVKPFDDIGNAGAMTTIEATAK